MKSEILIQSISKEIEIITRRIFAIKNVFFQTSSIGLRKRLSNEYAYLFGKFRDLKSKVLLINIHNKNSISYSTMLVVKYKRCEELIYQQSNLFFI
tara:strand:+ start:569 stop:856 length:288 start_codon:yes stop_codon:yes gene_type:complete